MKIRVINVPKVLNNAFVDWAVNGCKPSSVMWLSGMRWVMKRQDADRSTASLTMEPKENKCICSSGESFVFHNESVCNGLQSEHERVTDMNSSQKQGIFDSSVTQAQWLESLKDDNRFLGDGSSSTALIKTLSSPFSLRVGAVEKMLWCCGVVVGSVFCPCLFFCPLTPPVLPFPSLLSPLMWSLSLLESFSVPPCCLCFLPSALSGSFRFGPSHSAPSQGSAHTKTTTGPAGWGGWVCPSASLPVSCDLSVCRSVCLSPNNLFRPGGSTFGDLWTLGGFLIKKTEDSICVHADLLSESQTSLSSFRQMFEYEFCLFESSPLSEAAARQSDWGECSSDLCGVAPLL